MICCYPQPVGWKCWVASYGRSCWVPKHRATRDLRFTGANFGETSDIAQLNGKPCLVVMLVAQCETVCPLIVEDLKRISADLDAKKSTKTKFRSFRLILPEKPQPLSRTSLRNASCRLTGDSSPQIQMLWPNSPPHLVFATSV